jgi:NHL repeat
VRVTVNLSILTTALCMLNVTCRLRIGKATVCKCSAPMGTYGSHPGQFDYPIGIVVAVDDDVRVVDGCHHRIHVFTGEGVFLCSWGLVAVLSYRGRVPL